MGLDLQDPSGEFNVVFGLECSAGARTGCLTFYQYGPTEPVGVIFSETFVPSVGDMLEFTITVVNNKTITLDVFNYASDAQVTQTLTSTSEDAAPPYVSAAWIMQVTGGPPYLDFGTVQWYGTRATGDDGSQFR